MFNEVALFGIVGEFYRPELVIFNCNGFAIVCEQSVFLKYVAFDEHRIQGKIGYEQMPEQLEMSKERKISFRSHIINNGVISMFFPKHSTEDISFVLTKLVEHFNTADYSIPSRKNSKNLLNSVLSPDCDNISRLALLSGFSWSLTLPTLSIACEAKLHTLSP
jgi:hypothetical protein